MFPYSRCVWCVAFFFFNLSAVFGPCSQCRVITCCSHNTEPQRTTWLWTVTECLEEPKSQLGVSASTGSLPYSLPMAPPAGWEQQKSQCKKKKKEKRGTWQIEIIGFNVLIVNVSRPVFVKTCLCLLLSVLLWLSVFRLMVNRDAVGWEPSKQQDNNNCLLSPRIHTFITGNAHSLEHLASVNCILTSHKQIAPVCACVTGKSILLPENLASLLNT